MSEATVAVEFPADVRLRVLEHRAVQHDFSQWERAPLEAIAAVLVPELPVLDIGAEEGEFGAYMATLAAGGKHVHLIEPTPGYWPNIRAVWHANDLDGPGGCFQGFAGDTSRDAAAGEGWPAAADGLVMREGAFSFIDERPDIPAINVDDYCAAVGVAPAFMLIDVEGAEGLVLRGARETMRRLRPLIMLSLHPRFVARFGDSKAGIFGLLDELGYKSRHISTDHEEHWLCVPAERFAEVTARLDEGGRPPKPYAERWYWSHFARQGYTETVVGADADAQTRAQLAVLLPVLAPTTKNGGAVLELGSGDGRLALRVSEALDSARVVGVDTSPDMVAAAQRAADERLLDAWFVQGDGRRLPDVGPIAAAYSVTVLQHLPHGVQADYVRQVVEALEPDGVFIFQVVDARSGVEPATYSYPSDVDALCAAAAAVGGAVESVERGSVHDVWAWVTVRKETGR